MGKIAIEIAVEEVIRIQNERSAINALNFRDIVWTYQGKPIVIPEKLREEFALCGLNNMDFILSNFLPDRPWQSLAQWDEPVHRARERQSVLARLAQSKSGSWRCPDCDTVLVVADASDLRILKERHVCRTVGLDERSE